MFVSLAHENSLVLDFEAGRSLVYCCPDVCFVSCERWMLQLAACRAEELGNCSVKLHSKIVWPFSFFVCVLIFVLDNRSTLADKCTTIYVFVCI